MKHALQLVFWSAWRGANHRQLSELMFLRERSRAMEALPRWRHAEISQCWCWFTDGFSDMAQGHFADMFQPSPPSQSAGPHTPSKLTGSVITWMVASATCQPLEGRDWAAVRTSAHTKSVETDLRASGFEPSGLRAEPFATLSTALAIAAHTSRCFWMICELPSGA